MKKSKSEQYLESRSTVPQVSAIMASSVSQFRKQGIADELEAGHFREGSGAPQRNEHLPTASGIVIASSGMKKYGQAVGGGGFRGLHGQTVKQVPEVYSPLWLDSNLNLPRDRATINAWCRSFYALNPFVHNAVNLHSTYPISKLNIRCHNKDIEKFFNDMIEEIDLMNICVQIAQEYFLLGESFVYAELNESQGKWSRLAIQNPDYMIVKRTVQADEPIIMLRPDENLKKIVFSNRPVDVEQRKQLNNHIIDSVKRGENIPLDNYNVSHLARRISPYEIRGTGLPVCIFRQLQLFDKLRECFDDQTEVLTDQGFKKIHDLVQNTTNIQINPNYVNGITLDQDNRISSILTMKEDFKVACFNPENDHIEYHKPIELHMSQYAGKMLQVKGQKVDFMVTPNHKLWVNEKIHKTWTGYQKRPAQDLLKKTKYYRLQSEAKYVGGKHIDTVNVLGYDIPAPLYMKILGYMISEGGSYQYLENGRYDAFISTCQYEESDCYEDMRSSFTSFAKLLGKNCNHYTRLVDTGYGNHKTGTLKDKWSCSIHGKDISGFFINEIGTDGNCLSHFKKIPRWAMELTPELMSIMLDALVKGDGSEGISQCGTGSKHYRYSTVSKQLADDVYEVVYKLGFVPTICVSRKEGDDGRTIIEYIVLWSNTNYGNRPWITTCKKKGDHSDRARLQEVDYDGVVWCFEVPTGLFITRRNGKICVQGNSKYYQSMNMINPLTIVKVGTDGPDGLHPTYADLEAYREIFEAAQYDKDFKIFTHAGLSVERVGYGQGIYDISGDITQLIKEIYVGLQVPSVLLDGGSDTTYANGGVALDTLRQRYLSFRNMLSHWLKRKIFAPISHIQNFYQYDGGEKQLIIPEIDWNHMSLFDTNDYVQSMITLTQGEDAAKRVSLHTLYRSLGLEYEDEVRKMRKEAIQNAINLKEKNALQNLDLASLRTLDDDDEIPEPETTPGEAKAGEASPAGGEAGGGLGAPSGLPGLDLGLPPAPGTGAPSAPPAPPAPAP